MDYEEQRKGPKWGFLVCPGSSGSSALSTWLDGEEGEEEQRPGLKQKIKASWVGMRKSFSSCH